MIDKIIKYMRHSSGIKQEALAGKIGITQSTLSGYEIKKSNPRYSMVEKIAAACNFEVQFYDKHNKEVITADNVDEYLKKLGL